MAFGIIVQWSLVMVAFHYPSRRVARAPWSSRLVAEPWSDGGGVIGLGMSDEDRACGVITMAQHHRPYLRPTFLLVTITVIAPIVSQSVLGFVCLVVASF